MNGSVNVPGYTAAEVNKIVEDFEKLLASYAPASHNHLREILWPLCLELFPEAGAGNGGFVDFHYDGDEEKDYTTRLVEHAPGQLSIHKDGVVDATGVIPGLRYFQLGLEADGWTDLQQSKDAKYVTADNVVIAAPSPTAPSYAQWQEHNVRCAAQSDGKLTFACDSVPENSISVNILLLTI